MSSTDTSSAYFATTQPPTMAPFSPDLAPLLDHQTEIYQILTGELSRIKQKQTDMKPALDTEARLLALNENTRKRQWQITLIIGVWALAFAFIFMVGFFSGVGFPVATTAIVVSSIALAASISIYIEMQKHDPLNFDLLDMSPPNKSETLNTGQNGTDGGNAGMCTNETCCSDDTVFDPTQTTCIPRTDPRAIDILNGVMPTPEPVAPSSSFQALASGDIGGSFFYA